MTITHLIIPDGHAHPDHNNRRFDWLGKLILDLRPDKVINLGDGADMPSLSSYDSAKSKGFHGRTYRRDIDAFLESQERLWGPIKKSKKRKPWSVYLEGNHEERIRRAILSNPELEGTYGIKDLDLPRHYDEFIPYVGNTPGVINVDGVLYAHYFVSGVMGRAISGEHTAYSLLTKEFVSCTQGHVHTFDYAVRTTGDGRKVHGLVAGVFQDYESDWAGEVNKMWSSGVAIKRNVDKGHYDLQWVSLQALKREYGGV